MQNNDKNQLSNKKGKSNLENNLPSKDKDYQLDFNNDLTVLSSEELVLQFVEIDRQSRLLKGKILLELRHRFSSDKDLGQWLSTHGLSVGNQQARNQLMHLAGFFQGDRDMNGISITAAYLISAPKNKNKSASVYKKVHGKNLSVKEVKALLLAEGKEKQGETDNLKEKTKKKSNVNYEDDVKKSAINLIDKVMKGKQKKFKQDVFEKAIQLLKKDN